MSLGFSAKHFYERTNAGAGDRELRGEQPMDAGTTWTVIDNVLHMVDVSPKYRINFLNTLYPGIRPTTMFFYTQITVDNQYPRYDVRVAFDIGSAATPVRASIVSPLHSGPVTGLTAGVLGTLTGTSPAYPGPAAWSIDGVIDNVDVERAPLWVIQAPTFPGAEAIIGYQALLKLVVEFDSTGGGEGPPTAALLGVQVREFPA